MQWVSTFASGGEGGAPVYFGSKCTGFLQLNCPLRYFPSHVRESLPPWIRCSPDCADVLSMVLRASRFDFPELRAIVPRSVEGRN